MEARLDYGPSTSQTPSGLRHNPDLRRSRGPTLLLTFALSVLQRHGDVGSAHGVGDLLGRP